MAEKSSNTQLKPGESKNKPGYVRQLIQERKGRKKCPEVARAHACARKVLKQAADLADLLADQDASGAIRVLRAGLGATKLMWDGNARGWVEQPDWKARHDCAMTILAYRFGKPVERQLQISGTFEDLGQLFARVQDSPAARRALEDTQVSQPEIEEFKHNGKDN